MAHNVGNGQVVVNHGWGQQQMYQAQGGDPDINQRLGAILHRLDANEAALRAHREAFDIQNQQINVLSQAAVTQEEQIGRMGDQLNEQTDQINELDDRADSLEKDQCSLKIAVGVLSVVAGAGAGAAIATHLVTEGVIVASSMAATQGIGATLGAVVIGAPTNAYLFVD